MQDVSRRIRHGARILRAVVAGVASGIPRRLIDIILVVAALGLIGTLAAHYWLSDTVALVGIGAVLATLAFWKIPQWQTKAARRQSPDRDPFETENAARATLAQALGGLLLVIGLAVTWRQLQDTRRDQLTQQNIALTQQSLTREGQITGRFTTAVGQLGDDKIQIRLGGIYALERIARDSKEDTVAVMEVLTAFMRQSAPWPSVPGVATPLPDESRREQPFADVQAVLTVIERGRWAE